MAVSWCLKPTGGVCALYFAKLYLGVMPTEKHRAEGTPALLFLAGRMQQRPHYIFAEVLLQLDSECFSTRTYSHKSNIVSIMSGDLVLWLLDPFEHCGDNRRAGWWDPKRWRRMIRSRWRTNESHHILRKEKKGPFCRYRLRNIFFYVALFSQTYVGASCMKCFLFATSFYSRGFRRAELLFIVIEWLLNSWTAIKTSQVQVISEALFSIPCLWHNPSAVLKISLRRLPVL